MISQYRSTEIAPAGWLDKKVVGLEALKLIREAIAKRPGLIRKKLDGKNDTHCAMGCFWADHENLSVRTELIDQIAKVNDSVARDPKKRRAVVLAWLDKKIAALTASAKAP